EGARVSSACMRVWVRAASAVLSFLLLLSFCSGGVACCISFSCDAGTMAGVPDFGYTKNPKVCEFRVRSRRPPKSGHKKAPLGIAGTGPDSSRAKRPADREGDLLAARADHFDLDAAVLRAAFGGLVVRNRLLLALAFGVDAVLLHALLH